MAHGSRLTLAELLTLKDWTRREELLVLLHAAEARGLVPISTTDLAALFAEARTRPGNLHRDLAALAREGLILQEKRHTKLSQRGFIAAEQLLKSVGMLSDEPERSSVEPLRRVSAKLRTNALAIPSHEFRSLVEEALRCLDPSVAALRAAVVLGWAGGVARLRERLWSLGAGAINARLGVLAWKQRVTKEDDLDDLKDWQLLTLGHEMGFFDKAALKVLLADLDVRNASGHPTDVAVGVHRVEAFFEEVMSLLYV